MLDLTLVYSLVAAWGIIKAIQIVISIICKIILIFID